MSAHRITTSSSMSLHVPPALKLIPFRYRLKWHYVPRVEFCIQWGFFLHTCTFHCKTNLIAGFLKFTLSCDPIYLFRLLSIFHNVAIDRRQGNDRYREPGPSECGWCKWVKGSPLPSPQPWSHPPPHPTAAVIYGLDCLFVQSKSLKGWPPDVFNYYFQWCRRQLPGTGVPSPSCLLPCKHGAQLPGWLCPISSSELSPESAPQEPD